MITITFKGAYDADGRWFPTDITATDDDNQSVIITGDPDDNYVVMSNLLGDEDFTISDPTTFASAWASLATLLGVVEP